MESPGCGLLEITKPELTVAHEPHPSIPAIPGPLLRSRSGFPEFQPINDPQDIIFRRCPQGRNERRPQIQKPLQFPVPGEWLLNRLFRGNETPKQGRGEARPWGKT